MPKAIAGRKYNKAYDENTIEKALQAINAGLPIREAARRFKIPRATLQFRRSNKFVKTSLGPTPILTSDEEKVLVNWIIENHKRGFPRRKEDIQESVKEFLDRNQRKNPFVNNRPGEAWYKAFLRRNPEISVRTGEGVTAASANVSEQDIRKWFESIEGYLQSKGWLQILEDPNRVLNADETCFNLCPKNSKVLAPRGAKNVYEVEFAPSKATLTVMFAFTASGKVTPPMVVYPYKRLPVNVGRSVPEGWGIGLSDTGWMKSEVMFDYIKNILHPSLQKMGTLFPVILFLDGHSTHLTYELSCLCVKLEIILICLYPNSTRILQPADVAAFKPLKNCWKRAVIEWRRSHPLESLTKEHFAPVLKLAVDEASKSQTIKNGFRASGLFPWNPNSIDFSKCLGGQNKTKPEEEKKYTFLSYADFVAIVGKDQINKFETLNEQEFKYAEDNDFILYKLWKKFSTITNKVQLGDEAFKRGSPGVSSMHDPHENPGSAEVTQIQNFDLQDFILDESNIDEIPIIFSMPDNQQSITNNSTAENLLQFTFDIEEPIEDMHTEKPDVDTLKAKKDDDTDPAGNNTEQTIDNSSQCLKNALWYAKTPTRKGKKDTERASFAITSTQWLKRKKEEEEIKINKNLEKEERKRLRLEKQKEKNEKKLVSKINQKNKVKGKANKSKKTDKRLTKVVENISSINYVPEDVPNKENSCDHSSDSNIILKKTDEVNSLGGAGDETQEVLIPGGNKLEENEEFLAKEAMKQVVSRTSSPNVVECEESPNQEAISNQVQAVQKVKRWLFSTQRKTQPEFENQRVEIGLCFSCTYNITPLKHGIKCQSCSRLYHYLCIKKLDLHKSNSEHFTCQSCLRKYI